MSEDGKFTEDMWKRLKKEVNDKYLLENNSTRSAFLKVHRCISCDKPYCGYALMPNGNMDHTSNVVIADIINLLRVVMVIKFYFPNGK
jgi:hypothetical protein